ncbi:MAG: J domain-containing protein, partial [Polyangiales bacterium]
RELPEEYTHIQLSGTLRRRIDQAYAQLRTTTYYEFLGVAPDADREQIREAYFALAKIFHPDTQFRRELGDYKHKMEAVFGRLTRAYDVLSKRRLRAAYNEHLQALAAAGYSVYASLPTVR